MKQSNPMVDALRAEVKANPVFKDICHMFTLRQRTRGRLTVTRLKQAMELEGFKHTRKQLEDVLRFMGKLGLGTLDVSKRGKIRSLNAIKIKLQSIGLAALSASDTLQRRHEVNRYDNLVQQPLPAAPIETAPVAQPKVPRAKSPPIRSEDPYPVFLTMMVGNKLVNIPGPANITPENMAEFIVDFKKLSKKRDIDV